MDDEQKLNQLKTYVNEVIDIHRAISLLKWDQEVKMPIGGTHGRAQQLATLSRIEHIKFTSEEIGRLLEDLQQYAARLDPDSNDARLIRVTTRLFNKKTRVPADWVARKAEAAAEGYRAWEEARASSNFTHFRPYLERNVELRQEYAEYFKPYEHVYDPLLDEFEPGIKTLEVQRIFDDLRPQQVALIQAIAERPQVDDSFLHQPFDEKKQWDFGAEVVTCFGYDWKRGRQDTSPHPFTQTIGLGDVRITTRFIPDYPTSAMFSTFHESGHAIYEQGIDPQLDRTHLADGASLGLHESQSRLYENLVGRSYDFWIYYYPRLQELFPSQLANVSLDSFYKGINKVEPSLIRVEADEATYNLHIMLRLELEIALIEGKVAVKDLPEEWNDRMQAYLGLTPPNDAQGVLQDVHWSEGYIGYFSTYALGNLISAQLWECLNSDLPDLPEQIRRGEFSRLTGWLTEKIHRYGKKFEPQELVERATGSRIDPAPYLRYLQGKYGQIYGL
jgi:carboxypeptidase Taq